MRLSSRRRLLLLTVASGLVVLTAGCGGEDLAGRALAGMVRTPTPQLELGGFIDDQGATLDFAPPTTDGISLVYFGYTHCPDVCPTTLADVRSALGTLDSQDVARIGLQFITVDPERDTDEIVDDYVSSFVEGAEGVRVSDPSSLDALAAPFGASFTVETAPDGTVEVGHSAFLYALDAQSNLLVSWPFGTLKTELSRDFVTLLARMERDG